MYALPDTQSLLIISFLFFGIVCGWAFVIGLEA